MRRAMIVTGASRGIGAAIAQRAARAGYRVCVNYHQSPDRAQQVVKAIEQGGGEAIAVRADLGDEVQINAMFAEVDRRLGPLHALVNNAGIDSGDPMRIEDLRAGIVDRMLAVNVRGPLIACREAIRRMSTKHGGAGGTIVNISSSSTKHGGLPGDVVYAGTKGAIDAFSLGLAKEVAREGIRVISLRPGLTLTEIFDPIGGEAAVNEIAKTAVPMGRVGRPEEVANAVVWLCSEEASYMTGCTVDVTGGR
ncbi:MAG: SDR family oxidoreductase [Alphaproteobacteria bacterium]|nr:SDR family oxidoreductase [Alphaproteobacteria bacterium]